MDLLPTIATSFATAFATRGANGPGQTIDAAWNLTFGKFHNFYYKKQAKWDQDLLNYKNEIAENVSSIPVEHRQEAQLSLVGPALEASKYYIEEAEIRKMFAKLIASSIDERSNSYTHHAFVEIIKQLSPSDAKLLKYINSQEQNSIALAEYKAVLKEDLSKLDLSSPLIYDSPLNIEQTMFSLNNLSRLGLVDLELDMSYFTNESKYTKFYSPHLMEIFYEKSNNIHKQYSENLFSQIRGKSISNISQIFNNSDSEILNNMKPFCIDISKGILKTTNIGNNFNKVCL